MIFSLFNAKPTLKELIPSGSVDIHSHILPGIDDGAKNIQEALGLISEMEKIGFSKIIGTPHTCRGLYENTNKSIVNSFLELQKKLDSKQKISYASEYMLDNDIIKRVKEGSLLCLKENYVLVEMSYISAPINLYEIIFEIKTNNYNPVLAHPERYIFLHKNFEEYKKLKMAGCYFQGNLLSATGYYGKHVAEVLDKLLLNNMIDFVGSDIHKMSHIQEFSNKITIKNLLELEETIQKNQIFCDH